MRIYDINAGIGAPLKSERYTEADGLLRYMDDYKIEKALVWHGVADRSPEEGNGMMLEIAAASDRIAPCMLLEPSLDSLGLPGTGGAADRLRACGASAARVCQGGSVHFPMDAFYAQDMLKPLNDAHMPLILHEGYSPLFWHCLPEMAAAYPDIPFVILRWGLNESRVIDPLLKYTKNVYFDMSTMLDCGQIEEIVERFGSERLLFGSGLPHFVPAGALGLLLYSEISDADRENIAHANFERLEGGIRR